MRELAREISGRLPLQWLRALRLRANAGRFLFNWGPVLGRGFDGRAWDEIVRQAQAQAQGVGGSVLIATTSGAHLAALQFDALLAIALTLRGVKTSFLLCDAALPACMIDQHDWHSNARKFAEGDGARAVCSACVPIGQKYLGPIGLPIHRLGSLITSDDRFEASRQTQHLAEASAADWTTQGLRIGEHALAGALRFHARSNLRSVPHGDGVVRRFARSGYLAARAADRLLERERPDVLIAHHGIYTPQGIWVEAARKAGVRIVTWNPGYRRDSFLLSHEASYHHTMISEDTKLWENEPLTREQEQTLIGYLEERRRGASDWISFGSGREDCFDHCLAELSLDPNKPTIVLLTSVAWDAQLHYESNAFRGQTEWIDATIDFFKERADLNLVIRIHPAELTGFIRSQQKMADHIASRHGVLPSNIAVVKPENPMNTYALTDGCDAALIFSTKTGIELAARGRPVVVAGEAWIRGKGFSHDASSPADYRAILARQPFGKPIDPDWVRRARLYAYHFFFRRMIPLPGFEVRRGWPPYRAGVEHLGELAEGAHANLDMVCDHLLSGEPFLAAA